MSDDATLSEINKMITEAEEKLSDTLKNNAGQKSVNAIKGLIVYLREKQKEFNTTSNTENKNDSTKR